MILPTKIPLQPVKNKLTESKDISLFVLRLDLIDPITGGNKIFKLKYNLEEAAKHPSRRILTFGGAWSNHLAALAASRESVVGSKQLEVIAIIRGERPRELSDTLRFCEAKGLKLHFVTKEEYRRRNDAAYIEELKKQFGDLYLLPEGGSNELAVKGCAEILQYIEKDFNFICCPVGSGGTIAGISSELRKGQKAIVFAAIKDGSYLNDIIFSLNGTKHNFELITDHHFGGFAKTTPELLRFKNEFEHEQGFELDFVYTSKMFYGIFDLIKKEHFPKGSTIVALHTGGLQGNKGFTGS